MSSKNREPRARSPAMRAGDNGSYGWGVKRWGRHSAALLDADVAEARGRCWSSKTSTSRVSGVEERVTAEKLVKADWIAWGVAGSGIPVFGTSFWCL